MPFIRETYSIIICYYRTCTYCVLSVLSMYNNATWESCSQRQLNHTKMFILALLIHSIPRLLKHVILVTKIILICKGSSRVNQVQQGHKPLYMARNQFPNSVTKQMLQTRQTRINRNKNDATALILMFGPALFIKHLTVRWKQFQL